MSALMLGLGYKFICGQTPIHAYMRAYITTKINFSSINCGTPADVKIPVFFYYVRIIRPKTELTSVRSFSPLHDQYHHILSPPLPTITPYIPTCTPEATLLSCSLGIATPSWHKLSQSGKSAGTMVYSNSNQLQDEHSSCTMCGKKLF